MAEEPDAGGPVRAAQDETAGLSAGMARHSRGDPASGLQTLPALLRHRFTYGPLSRWASLPMRIRSVAGHNARTLRTSARWLVSSREYTNYTHDLEPLNVEHLAWFVADVTGIDVGTARGYLRELSEDDDLARHIARVNAHHPRGATADSARYGKRLGWYAITRAIRPTHVVECGTDRGLGSVVFAAALLRNGTGTLTTIDINPMAGYLIRGRYADVTRLLIGDSLEQVRALTDPVDLFLHDSARTGAHERAELAAMEPHLTPSAVVLSNSADISPELPHWAERTGRRFTFFAERPVGHWHRGCGIGAALPPGMRAAG